MNGGCKEISSDKAQTKSRIWNTSYSSDRIKKSSRNREDFFYYISSYIFFSHKIITPIAKVTLFPS